MHWGALWCCKDPTFWIHTMKILHFFYSKYKIINCSNHQINELSGNIMIFIEASLICIEPLSTNWKLKFVFMSAMLCCDRFSFVPWVGCMLWHDGLIFWVVCMLFIIVVCNNNMALQVMNSWCNFPWHYNGMLANNDASEAVSVEFSSIKRYYMIHRNLLSFYDNLKNGVHRWFIYFHCLQGPELILKTSITFLV